MRLLVCVSVLFLVFMNLPNVTLVANVLSLYIPRAEIKDEMAAQHITLDPEQQMKAVTTAPHDIDIISTIAGISVVNVATESELSVSSSELNNELKNRDTAFGNAYYYGDSEVLRAKCGGKKNTAIKMCKNACDEAYSTACEELHCYKKLKKKTKKLCKVFCTDEFY